MLAAVLATACLPAVASAEPTGPADSAAAKQLAPSEQEKDEARVAVERMNELESAAEAAYSRLNEAERRLAAFDEATGQLQNSIDCNEAALLQIRTQLDAWTSANRRLDEMAHRSARHGSFAFTKFALHAMTDELDPAPLIEQAANLSAEEDRLADEFAQNAAARAAIDEERQQAVQAAAAADEALQGHIEYYDKLKPEVRESVLAEEGVRIDAVPAEGEGGSISEEGAHPEVAQMALEMLDIPYVWGGEDTSGFDCSGLAMYCYEHAEDIDLTHFARTQYFEGLHIDKDALMPGDLVFFGANASEIHHVGIYIGEGEVVHAPHTGDVVKITKLADFDDYLGACRP